MGRFTPKFACGRSLDRDMKSPLLGVGGPRRAEKGANEIFVTMGVNGGFLHFGGFSAMSQQRLHGSTPNIICVGTRSADVPPPTVVPIGPWGAGEGELNTQKIGGWSHSFIGQLPFLFFSAMPNVVQYVGLRPAHILVYNRQDRPRRFDRVVQKVRKNFKFFTISRLYVHISQKLLKIEAYRQRMEKSFISPYPNVACVWTIGHGVL